MNFDFKKSKQFFNEFLIPYCKSFKSINIDLRKDFIKDNFNFVMNLFCRNEISK